MNCCRTALFIKSCLGSDSPVVSTVAHCGIYYGHMNCHLGRYFFFCCSQCVVTDTISVTRNMVSHYADSPPSLEPQCCFYLSYCLSEKVFLAVLFCRHTILMSRLILYAFLNAN